MQRALLHLDALDQPAGQAEHGRLNLEQPCPLRDPTSSPEFHRVYLYGTATTRSAISARSASILPVT